MKLCGKTIGFALTGSFCTLRTVIPYIKDFTAEGASVLPIVSDAVATCDTRFGTAADFCDEIETLSQHPLIRTITEAEPIGPRRMLDLLIIAPCTGNTLAKLACGIADTAVTMAAKSHLRNGRPILLAVSTNDGLGTAGRNISQLRTAKNIYLVPYGQDDPIAKENSLIADFSLLLPAAEAALDHQQLQPLLQSPK